MTTMSSSIPARAVSSGAGSSAGATSAGSPAAHAPAALRCKGLVKRYGDLVAVDHLDLEVASGECFGLLGPNGAGKTTTIEILEGLLQPDGGEVEVLGLRWDRHEHELRERLGIQLQEAQFTEKLTVEELVRLFRSFYKRGRTVEETIALVGLESKRQTWFSKLSGGQKQRVALACALVSRPDLLFLDEPTTGLDPQSRRQLWSLMVQFKAEGGTSVLTTHYMDEAETLCDRIAIVDRGKVIALGTPRELIRLLGAEHIVEFSMNDGTPAPEETVLRGLPGVRDVRHDAAGWHLVASEIHLVVPALLDALGARRERLAHLGTHSATLEDVFVSLTGRHLRDE
jgi:ABC-2 type transport system ATP-binding protein